MWEKAYKNTKKIKNNYFGFDRVCGACGVKTDIKQNNKPERQVLGNSIETIVYCSACNNPFVTSHLYGS
jgi:hypothetical protein